jgi:hypothetical protein
MNYDLAKAARFDNGFNTRIQQLALKSAANGEFAKLAMTGRLANMFARMAPRIEQAAPMAGLNIAGGAGKGIGKLMGAPVSIARGVGRGLMGTPGEAGAISRFVGGAGEGLLGAFGEGGKRLGQRFNRLATGRVAFGAPKPVAAGAPGATAADVAKGTGVAAEATPGAAGAAGPATPAPAAPTAAPGTVGGGTTPGTISTEQLAGQGVIPTNRSWTGGPTGQGELFPNMAGDPTKGLLGRMQGMLPQGAKDWIANNPNLASAGAGALGGGAVMGGINEYGDYRRRQALENLGFMQRLGLALQLATNPQGFSNTLQL